MSSCRSASLRSRRRLAAIAASLAASAPLLLRHSGASDWTDMTLGAIVGVSIGVAAVMLIVSIRRASNAE